MQTIKSGFQEAGAPGVSATKRDPGPATRERFGQRSSPVVPFQGFYFPLPGRAAQTTMILFK